mmetsp:Transcript_6695/g.14503  ORF Transcript_6695/g.14503 Transcript_6695/m.14503 type:complete len:94 (+) Transcript_6695:1463-1744(+)
MELKRSDEPKMKYFYFTMICLIFIINVDYKQEVNFCQLSPLSRDEKFLTELRIFIASFAAFLFGPTSFKPIRFSNTFDTLMASPGNSSHVVRL